MRRGRPIRRRRPHPQKNLVRHNLKRPMLRQEVFELIGRPVGDPHRHQRQQYGPPGPSPRPDHPNDQQQKQNLNRQHIKGVAKEPQKPVPRIRPAVNGMQNPQVQRVHAASLLAIVVVPICPREKLPNVIASHKSCVAVNRQAIRPPPQSVARPAGRWAKRRQTPNPQTSKTTPSPE